MGAEQGQVRSLSLGPGGERWEGWKQSACGRMMQGLARIIVQQRFFYTKQAQLFDSRVGRLLDQEVVRCVL